MSTIVGSAADGANAVPRTVGLNSFVGVVLERSRTCEIHERMRRRNRACWEPLRSILLLTGIATASGTDTASRSSETRVEPYEDRAKAEQPKPIATEKKKHSSFVE